MNWRVLNFLFRHELRMLLRARRTVFMAIVLPAVIMPLMLYAQKYSFERSERLRSETTYRYAISGELSGRARMLIQNTLARLRQDAEHAEQIDQLRPLTFVETTTNDPRASLEKDEIHFYIEALSGSEADARDAEAVHEQSRRGNSAGWKVCL